jgi:cell division protease FtsH
MLLRHRRGLRLTVTWAAVVFLVYLAAAWFFGVADGSGNSLGQVSPATATRNFFTYFPTMLRTVVPMVLQLAVGVFFAVFQFVAIFWFMSRGRTYTLFPGEYEIRFDDVRGQSHIVSATRQVMQLFQGFKDFRRIGGYPPHGILFEGPPGTGKTLLAKAIAGESGVPFVYASGASFAAMFLGVGNLRIQRMFAKARKYSEKYGGCVIFIDEIDAVGAARSGSGGGVAGGMFGAMGGGMGLVNELLTQMDGIDQPKRLRRLLRRTFKVGPRQTSSSYNILVVGATNMASTLDPALLRPGRFDRKIHVGNPGEVGRRDIIAYYLNKVVHTPIDIDRVARATAGYSPARIKNVINEALIYALQDGRQALTFDDIWKAKLTDEIGLEDPVEYGLNDKERVAVHEGGHAVAGHFLRPWLPVQIVSIRKRGGAGGVTVYAEEEEMHFSSKSQMLATIATTLAGMAAEEMWMGESSNGPAGDLQQATSLALQIVTRYGQGSQLTSLALLDGRNESDLATALRDENIRHEIDAILQECKRNVQRLLEGQRPAMEAVRDALIARGEITGDEFRTLLWEVGAVAEPPRVLPQLPVHAGADHELVGIGRDQ